MSNVKTKEIFCEKKRWSQMIQNCLIRREMAKKKFWRQMAIFGGRGGTAAVFLNIREICPKSKLLPFLTIGLR